ncbi:broad substrate specificity ATP-binding cassette transporter ABCG2-like isoform X2 [Cavia porcellus]|uniref:broad substrate specificity ATP-binding cassette transporter ABCG2-like isoform X2 n=1 Tax=Cavia porcellus TaxID=10141 RepID=UPI000661CCD3|nr:ATP-binding cassette sub-family G member 2-like isoform X2 [Cavia porcellus]
MSSSNVEVSIPLSQRDTNDLSEMTSSDLKSCTKKAILSFCNISYQVKVKSGFLLGRKTVENEILSNISGIMRPGLNAILGPTGAGKSVLLDVLAARKHPEKFSKDVLINGEPRSANFKYHSGYVTQDDVMMGTLTVRENLRFSAALRLPMTMTNHEKNRKINEIIEQLGLCKVADVQVGTEQIHGVSRSERKKTSIAIELVTNPSILFLDEPTNALDSSTAHNLFLLLKRISKQGRTIIFSIRQPRHSVFKIFDSITLLAAGKLIFHGPVQSAIEHFASAGYNCEPCTNPADFFLDVISGDLIAMESDRDEEDHECENIEEFSFKEESVTEKLAKFYVNSSLYRDTKSELDQLSHNQQRSSAFKEFTYATSFWHQLRWISWRSCKNFVSDRRTSILEIITIIMEGLLIAGFFFGIKNDCSTIQTRVWMFYVLTACHCFAYVSAVQIFLGEKQLFEHEHMSGYYRQSSYFLEKVLCNLLPRRLLQSFIITIVVYLIVELNPAVKAFFIMLLTLWMVACSADFMTLALTIDQNLLNPMTTFLTVRYFHYMLRFSVMALFFGISVSQLSWLQYISIPYFGMKFPLCFRLCSTMTFWGKTSVKDSVKLKSVAVQTL